MLYITLINCLKISNIYKLMIICIKNSLNLKKLKKYESTLNGTPIYGKNIKNYPRKVYQVHEVKMDNIF